MNYSRLLIIITFVIFTSSEFSYSQTPEYILSVRNCELISINYPDDAMIFDIYILHTNSPQTFEYAGGQYFFSFNKNVLSPGAYPPSINDTTQYSFKVVGSDLPANMIPRNPSFGTASNPAANVLRMAVSALPPAGSGYMIGSVFPGTLIARMRIWNKQATFNLEFFNLLWRNPPIVSFATKIIAYIGTTLTDITTPNTHENLIEYFLPVELKSFTSVMNKNKVNLIWTTSRELNNSSFNVERMQSSTNDWKKITNIKGSGTTEEAVTYSYCDMPQKGRYSYRLKQIDFNGNSKFFYLENEVNVGAPENYFLSQNYPNPFNPVTRIDYELPHDGFIKITIYDISGREINNPVNEYKPSGYYSLLLNGNNLSTGAYFYRMESGNFSASKKMVVIK